MDIVCWYMLRKFMYIERRMRRIYLLAWAPCGCSAHPSVRHVAISIGACLYEMAECLIGSPNSLCFRGAYGFSGGALSGIPPPWRCE